MLRFMHLPTVVFMSFSLCAVCKMSVTSALFEKMIPNAHKLPRILSALLVTVFTSFLIIFLISSISMFILHIYF